MAQSKGSKPTHGAFHVRQGKNGGKGFWTRIGAGWVHDDGKGINVNLDLIPVGDGQIVIRLDDGKSQADTTTKGEAA